MQDEHGCSCQVARNLYDAARCASCSSRERSDFIESCGGERCNRDRRFRACLTFAVTGMAHDAGKPPRDHVGGAQIGLGEYHDDGAIVLGGAEIHLPHQAAENPRAVEPRARMVRIEGKAGDRQSAAMRQR